MTAPPITDDILGASPYDEATARTYEGYTEELENPHTPETEEYGISSVVFRSDRPFNKDRLLQVLRSTTGLVRSKGYCWIADHLNIVQVWHQAGPNSSIRPAAYWANSEITPGTELVLIGIRIDVPTLLALLQGATLTDAEVAALVLCVPQVREFHSDFARKGSVKAAAPKEFPGLFLKLRRVRLLPLPCLEIWATGRIDSL